MAEKPDRRILKKTAVIMALLLLVATGIIIVKKKKARLASVPPPSEALIPVTAVHAPYGVFTARQKFLSTVMPKISADIAARITAHILEIRGREGKIVKKGELLALLDDREQKDLVSSLEARLASARTALATEEAIYQRDKRLFDAKAVSRETLDLSKSRRDAARAQVITLEKQLDSARTILSYTRLKAPFDGVITARVMEPGDLAVPGKTIVSLEAPDAGYYVRIKIPQLELPDIKTGDTVILAPDAPGDSRGMALPPGPGSSEISAVVSRIHPAVRAGTLGIIEADIPARPWDLPTGSSVNVLVHTGQYEGMKVPLRALLEQVQSVTVFTVSSHGTVHIKSVRLLYRGADWAVVRVEGLDAGAVVITAQESALLRLHEGQKVAIVKNLSADRE